MERVLVVDDGDLDRKIVRDLLESAGYEVEEAADGETALRLLYQRQPDLVLLDVVLPRMDGWTICRRIRELCDTPVIMLTSLNSEDEIARGLDLGADDFISKPIGATSLLARVRAVLRRAGAPQHEPASVYDDGSLRIEPALRRVTVDGSEIDLTPTEFRLLETLASQTDRVLRIESS
jgi:DNA-binding response OmpR family regulator